MSDAPTRSLNFIEQIIEADNAAKRWGAWPDGRPRVCTRFPPEPNGYLHIGHAKSICLNYGLADRYGGQFNLRFDDTNPVKEEQEYVDSIIADVRWLGARWPGMSDAAAKPGGPCDAGVVYASDYFGQMCEWAIELIKKGKAYVCDCTAEEIRRARGTLTRPGTNCAHRERTIHENAELFERMRKGEFADGSRTLRAKIDMASANLNLRDPVMYRILHSEHHRQGDKWCIYPMYDWAHGFEDSIEGITHSICTLEFENHRPLYDWFIGAVNDGRTADGGGPWGKRIHHPQQIEFARLNLSYTVMSKRKLLHLVKGGHVGGWDDPRMPTISGLRRRGVTPESIRTFCEQIGVAKFNGVIELQKLESCIRDDLNRRAPRVMAVVRPLKVVIENWPDESKVDWLDAVNNPEDPSAGGRKVPFGKVLYIERDDFLETPPKGYFRLAPGAEVRLRYAYFVRCTSVVKDPATGEMTEVRCTYDPATRGGDAPDGRKVKGTIHWVSAAQALDAEVRLYETLFAKPDPEDTDDATADADGATMPGAASAASGGAAAAEAWLTNLNPNSLQKVAAKIEPNWHDAAKTANWSDGITRVQFERVGYFCVDRDSAAARLVFNRTVTLKDSWAKAAGKS
ncbi:MAG: glutamine--tRNA ligase/YqeY domain fusion protein [Phycisphaerae bacterium]|nr:glutamine--tRNA ligase/YqeY domain fusion protein [Phycisphaerae bacterium]